MSLFQWIMRRMNANREELNTLLSDFNPVVVCLQKTQLKANTNIDFKHYSIYQRAGNDINATTHSNTAIRPLY